MWNRFWQLVTYDLGIDLGTANTLVYVVGKGIVIREPSVVAITTEGDLLAIGEEARRMVGKTPEHIRVERPLRHGAVSDFEVAERMLKFFIRKVHHSGGPLPKLPRPRVVIGVPTGITEVEQKAVSDAALAAGAREVYLVEQPLAAAIGAGLPVKEPRGSMLVDIGGGTCEIAVISLGGIVTGRSLRLAGDDLDAAVVNYARENLDLVLGEISAEEIKCRIGRVGQPPPESAKAKTGKGTHSQENSSQGMTRASVRGRDVKTGLPRTVSVSADEIGSALEPVVLEIVAAIKDVIQETPPELVVDVIKGGITLAGGGSLLTGLDQLIATEAKIKVSLAEDPISCVVRGCARLYEDPPLLARVRVNR